MALPCLSRESTPLLAIRTWLSSGSNKACQEHDSGVIWLKVDPTLDNLRSDPRFDAILQDMRLSDKPAQARNASEEPSQPIDSLAILPLRANESSTVVLKVVGGNGL